MNWDHLKVALAVARAGSLAGAARQLSIDETTVGRRLSALEHQLGGALFFRSKSGFELTSLGKRALEGAETMEAVSLKIAEETQKEKSAVSGNVRIASMPWVFNHLLVPHVQQLYKNHPELQLDAIADLRERSLSRREAEIALRFEMKPRGDEIEIPIGQFPFAVYAPVGYDPATLPWLGSRVDSGSFEPERWVNEMSERDKAHIAFRANDAGVLFSCACAGTGKALLPDVLAKNDARLVRVSGPSPELIRTLRVLVHPDVQYFARIKTVIDWISEVIKDLND